MLMCLWWTVAVGSNVKPAWWWQSSGRRLPRKQEEPLALILGDVLAVITVTLLGTTEAACYCLAAYDSTDCSCKQQQQR